MSAHLLRSRKFAPLFWCQFFAAFNDTYLKSALTFIVVAKLAPAAANTLTLVGSILLTAPPFLLAALGGQWADRYDKAKVAQWLKLVEFGAVAIAAAGFVFGSVPLLFIALAMFGVLSALFGPVKYGILPDHLTKAELPGGNALVEGATFIAAILGPTAAALATRSTHDMRWAAGLCIGFAAIAYVAARFIPATGQAAPTLKVEANVAASTWRLLRTLRADRRLWRGAVITSLFWSMAVVVYTLLTPIVELGLGGDPLVFNIYNALFAIGIALGSGLAAWLLAGRTLMLPTPIAAAVLGLVSLDLAATLHNAATLHGAVAVRPLLAPAAFFSTWRAWHVGLDLLLLAMAGGLYIVPAFAAVQAWAPVGPARPRDRRRQRAERRLHRRRPRRDHRAAEARRQLRDDLPDPRHRQPRRLGLDPVGAADQPAARPRRAWSSASSTGSRSTAGRTSRPPGPTRSSR